MTKPKPKLTMEALAIAMEPPNNCRVKKFMEEHLDAQSREVFETALKLDKSEFPASAVREFLIASDFDAEVIPGDSSIQDHRNGRRPCRCKG